MKKLRIEQVNSTLIREKLMYQLCNLPKKYEKIFQSWLETLGLDSPQLVLARLLQM